MSIQSQIQKIIDDRQKQLQVIENELANIDNLSSMLRKVKDKINEANVENASQYNSAIDIKIRELLVAKEKAILLQERFNKNSVNIGVSGFTHAGKSTLLQAISGLTDEEIPKANENSDNFLHATTAICSQIFNSDKEFAEIVYKSEDEFVESVNVYTKKLNIDPISSKSDVPKICLPEREDGEPEKNTSIDRLNEMIESYSSYASKIAYKKTSQTLTRAEFPTLSHYVSCQANDVEHRYYPAVQEVKIYCKFPSFSGENVDTKICLVDLPGFGNFDDAVQTKGLKDKVDHIIFIYKTNKEQSIDNDHYVKCQRTILNINDFKENKLSFETFIINEDKTFDIYAKLTEETKQAIKQRYGNYATYAFSAFKEPDKSREVLNTILETLTTTLPKMDEELVASYKLKRDLSEVNELITKLLASITQKMSSSSLDSEIFKDADKLRKDLSKGIDKLLKKYEEKAEDSDFDKIVEQIRNSIDEKLNENLMFTPINVDQTWEEYAEEEASAEAGWEALVPKECHRIWTAIIDEYEKLNENLANDLVKMKEDVLDIFKTASGSLLQNDTSEGLEEIISIVSTFQDNCLKDAFLSLKDLKQDFRHNIYPYIFKQNIHKLLTPMSKGGQVSFDFTNVSAENFKAQMVEYASEANYNIYKEILNVEAQAYFFIGAIHTFGERAIRSHELILKDYQDFYRVFKTRLNPKKYGNEDGIKLEQLKVLLEQTIKIIENYN